MMTTSAPSPTIRHPFPARLLAFWVCLAIWCGPPALPADAADYGATLTAVDGSVTLWNPTAADWLPVAVNLPLAADSRLRVAKGASADILFDDGSIVTLEGAAEVELLELAADTGSGRILATLFMKAGKLLANIAAFVHRESRFSVQTPTAVAGVRGTQFVVETSEAEGTEVGVFEGRVAVDGIDPAGRADAGSRVLLEKGYQTRVRRLMRPGAPSALKARMRRHRGGLDRLAKRAKITRRDLKKIRNQRTEVQKKMLKRWRKTHPNAFKPAAKRPGAIQPKPKQVPPRVKQKIKRRRPPKK
jgi:hypothetical protein